MKVVDIVEEVAKEVGATPAQVALNWVIERESTVSALVGVKTLKELEEDVEASDMHMTREQLDRLDRASREFWAPMPPELELWIPDSRRLDIERLGIAWRTSDYYKSGC
jgi:aryl-alcohol dehydrogenase-like predicted oxidoreductase